jgi:hypothetical protein
VQARAASRCLVLLTMTALAGCGGSGDGTQFEVTGTVTYQGKIVPSGTVLFQPGSGKAIVAVIDEEGRYEMLAPSDTYQVAVVSSAGIPDDVDPWQANVKLPPPLVPAKYGRPETSGTKVTVAADNTTLDISLR